MYCLYRVIFQRDVTVTSLFTCREHGFTEQDKVAIRFFRENKLYGAKRFLEKFPAKQWCMVAEWSEQNFEENRRERFYRINVAVSVIEQIFVQQCFTQFMQI